MLAHGRPAAKTREEGRASSPAVDYLGCAFISVCKNEDLSEKLKREADFSGRSEERK